MNSKWRYWGVALIALGVLIAGAVLVAWNAYPIPMAFGLCMAALALIAGISITVAAKPVPAK